MIRSVTKDDTGSYVCVATSAGVFDVETATFVEAHHRGRFNIEQKTLLSVDIRKI